MLKWKCICTWWAVPELLIFSLLIPTSLPSPGRVCAKKNQIPRRRNTRMIAFFQKCKDSFQIVSCAASFALICSCSFDLVISFKAAFLLLPITTLHWLISIPILTKSKRLVSCVHYFSVPKRNLPGWPEKRYYMMIGPRIITGGQFSLGMLASMTLEFFRSWKFPVASKGWVPWKFPGPEKIQVGIPGKFQGPQILYFWRLADFIWKPPTISQTQFCLPGYCIFPKSLGL